MMRRTIQRNELKPCLMTKPLWVIRLYSRTILVLKLPLIICTPMFTCYDLADVIAEWWSCVSARFVENDNKHEKVKDE